MKKVARHRPILRCVQCVDARTYQNPNSDLRFLGARNVILDMCTAGGHIPGAAVQDLFANGELASEIGAQLFDLFLGDLTTMFQVLRFEATLP